MIGCLVVLFTDVVMLKERGEERKESCMPMNEYRSDFVSSWDDHDSKTKSKVKHRCMCVYIYNLPTILPKHVLMNIVEKKNTRQDYQSFCQGADESNQEAGWKWEE